MLTLPQLQAVMLRLPAEKAEEYLPHLNAAMEEFDILEHAPGCPAIADDESDLVLADCGECVCSPSPARMAAFLAQLAHESRELTRWEEMAHFVGPNGGPVPGCRLCKPGKPIGSHNGEQYEDRHDLGNTEPGDGVKFKGRGCLQITGRANYTAAGKMLGLDLVVQPELVLRPEVNFRVAGWFWQSRDLNRLADAGDFREITRRINGGYHGLADRERHHEQAKKVLVVGSTPC